MYIIIQTIPGIPGQYDEREDVMGEYKDYDLAVQVSKALNSKGFDTEVRKM